MSFDYEFLRFDSRNLEVESLGRIGGLFFEMHMHTIYTDLSIYTFSIFIHIQRARGGVELNRDMELSATEPREIPRESNWQRLTLTLTLTSS